MLRTVINLAVWFTLSWLAPIAVIRSQPYDDGGVRALLTSPQGCSAPCFMGIQPGTTTLNELVLIIAQHEWVAERFRSDYTTLASQVDARGDSVNPILRWEWRPHGPPGSTLNRPVWSGYRLIR